MKMIARMVTTAAIAVFLMPAILPRTGEAQAVMAASSGPNNGTPKAEVFVGYSYLRAVPAPSDGNRLVWLNGGSTSLALNFNRHLGLVGDFGGFDNSQYYLTGANPPSTVNSSGSVYTYLFGPRLSFRNHSRITPFAQVLFGGIHASQVTLSSGCMGAGCTPLPTENSFAMTAGGGLDINAHRHFAIRIIQAEYLMTQFENHATGNSASQNDMRLSSGIVFRFGGNSAPPPPVTLVCSANPASVFPGDPVMVTATAGNLNPKLNVVYSLTGPGITANIATATVATATLAPGSYTVNCGVKEGKPGKEGLRPWESATATAAFAVKAFEPPTIGCSASPSTIKPGESSTVTASGISPQNRPLTYSYSAASGTVNGNGTTAEFNSAGAPAGSTAITCNVTDDKGQTATADARLTIMAPPPPLESSPEQVRLEARLALHSVFFQTDVPRIESPKGGLVVSQEKTLATLASDFKRYLELKPDAHLTLSGHADMRGSVEYNQALSERRVTRTKLFLVEQGVPEAKIEILGLGKEDNLTSAQVEEAIKQNPDLTAADREKLLHNLPVIVLAKNRRVDITLSTTGQQSVRWYPFNAADALILLDQRNLTHKKRAAAATR
jgi:outer membrane protein OmpA-like peptidoglycan-associated protein/opacity protein-like surface antigen